MTIAIYTLGCKLNQLESESIADAFKQKEFTVIPGGESLFIRSKDSENPISGILDDIILFIVNTCTVTSKSEQKARRIIRRALRDVSNSAVLVTGCYAQMDSLESLADSRLFVIPQDQKNRILELPAFLRSQGMQTVDSGNSGSLKSLQLLLAAWTAGIKDPNTGKDLPENTGSSFCYIPGHFTFHSRAFIKIQDGCDNLCSYCRVPLARGKSRSRQAEQVLEILQDLEEKGFAEAVLTGVNISQYKSRAGNSFFDLPLLLDYLLSQTGKIRLRLSSIEPEVFGPDFFRVVSNPRIRPHFHISLQSGSPEVLRRMKRNYTPAFVRENIRLLRSVKTDPFLGCDIITGFPGETRDDFAHTRDFLEETEFAGIHVFPFSRRPGTEAWDYRDRIPEKETGNRTAELIALAGKLRTGYIERWTGKIVEAAAENQPPQPESGLLVPALSENYLKLLVSAKNGIPKPAKLLKCRITGKANGKFDAYADIVIYV